jgi:hypothetical protein
MIEMSAAQTQFVVLAPAGVARSRMFTFRDLEFSRRRYEDLLTKLQRFRGRVYLQDGAISAKELTADGRHRLDIDERSWHVLAVDRQGDVCACVRYLQESPDTDFHDLWIREAAIARCPTWGGYFRRAVEQERATARNKRVQFAEVGGWAVAESRRGTTDPMRMILGVCGLSKILGGSIGVATATVRHGSAAILRRLGLSPLAVNGVALPAYYDPHYGCEMEALRFDSDRPNPKYSTWIDQLRNSLELAPVVCKTNRAAEWVDSVRVLESPKLPAPYPLFMAS